MTEPKPFPQWHLNPFNETCECLIEGTVGPAPEYVITGEIIGMLEDFGYACYPTAFNATTHNWERGGAYHDRIAAKQWVERVAGLHPSKPGDERPAFYYVKKE